MGWQLTDICSFFRWFWLVDSSTLHWLKRINYLALNGFTILTFSESIKCLALTEYTDLLWMNMLTCIVWITILKLALNQYTFLHWLNIPTYFKSIYNIPTYIVWISYLALTEYNLFWMNIPTYIVWISYLVLGEGMMIIIYKW